MALMQFHAISFVQAFISFSLSLKTEEITTDHKRKTLFNFDKIRIFFPLFHVLKVCKWYDVKSIKSYDFSEGNDYNLKLGIFNFLFFLIFGCLTHVELFKATNDILVVAVSSKGCLSEFFNLIFQILD